MVVRGGGGHKLAHHHTNVCNFRNLSELYSRSLMTYHFEIWQFYFTNIVAKFVVLRCAFCKHRRDFGFISSVKHFSKGGVCKSQSGRLRMTLDFSIEARKSRWRVDFLSEEGGRRCFVLASDKNKKDQKNLRSKLI